jgi:FkbM family methyltransferase
MVEEIEFNGVKALVRKDTMDEFTFKEIFKKQEYKKLNFTSKDIVLDFGMNIGMFSIYALNHGVKKVYSFEPNKENFQLAQDNLKLNNLKDSRFVLTNKAVIGNNDKIRYFHENLKTNKGAHSLIRVKGRNDIVVGCVNINDVVKKIKPTIIKMDIEGAEYECLKGLKEWKGINQIILEFHHKVLKDIETHSKYKEILKLLKSKFNNVVGREDTKGSWVSLIYCSN